MGIFIKTEAEQKAADVTKLATQLHNEKVPYGDRAAIAFSLGKIAEQEPDFRERIAGTLKKALYDPYYGVVNTSATALGRCGESAVPYIRDLVKALERSFITPSIDRETIANSLIAVGKISPEAAERVEKELDAAMGDDATREQERVLRKIGEGLAQNTEITGDGAGSAKA